MKTISRRKKGSAIITVIVLTLIISTACIGTIYLSSYRRRSAQLRLASKTAFRTAENAMLEGVQKLSDELIDPTLIIGTYYMGGQGDQALDLSYNLPDEVQNVVVTIEADPMGIPDNFLVTAAAQVLVYGRGGVNEETGEMGRDYTVRVVQSLVRWRPPSQVFDYEYFLNNWGWWWGGVITGYGDNRSNWDFDFKYNPVVNGHIFANGDVESNKTPVNPFEGSPPFRGLAGDDPLSYCHVGAPRINMPNLMDLTYYEDKADGSIVIGGTTMVDGVHGDDEGKNGIYLKGTSSDPIEIDGSVVVRGDLVIEGYVTGKGTFYVGGNLYVADEIKYADGPDYSSPPETMSYEDRNDWVDANMDKDMVAFAVKETILVGKVDGSWKNYCYNNNSYGLKNVGDESNLGPDGIKGTPDDGLDYLDTDGDGLPDSSWYDADGDGVIDDKYDFYDDLQMNGTRIADIDNWPVDEYGNLRDYSDVATSHQRQWDGIFYTNHAIASYVTTGPSRYHGALITRDEAIIFRNRLDFRYDSRIHSRYQRKYFDGDPNRIIDLGLPISEEIRILDRYELSPLESDLIDVTEG